MKQVAISNVKQEADKHGKPTPTLDDAEAFVRATFGSSQCLMRECFLTGSVAFGEANEESDIDIGFSIVSRGAVEGLLLAKGIAQQASDYNSGVHADVAIGADTFRVNFLFLHPLDYIVWRKAGKIYESLPRQGTRAARHALFQSLCAIVKTAFALSGIEVHKKNYLSFGTGQAFASVPIAEAVSPDSDIPF